MPESRVTINDIARLSDVSIATVSMVLNNRPGISQDTRNRVLEAAQNLGYTVKPIGLINRQTRLTTLGMVVKSMGEDRPPQNNPFYSKVILGIEEACRRYGVNLLFSTLPVDEDNHPLEIPNLIVSGLADGLLLVGTFVDKTIATIMERCAHTLVLVDGYSTSERYDAVVSDNFRAAYQAVDYLIHKNHRHIAMVGGEPDAYPSLRERRNGYVRALKEHQLSGPYFVNFNINKMKGYEETRQFLQSNPQVTAIFGINDDIAITAMHAAQSLGKHVPGDISVIGYDDTFLAENSQPRLTTMHVGTVSMGRAAVQLLALRLEDQNAARMTLTIHPELVERESVVEARW
jgi:LacI family transcriptional regulator